MLENPSIKSFPRRSNALKYSSEFLSYRSVDVGPVSPSRGSCKQPRSSCVPPPTYHHQRPESHKQSPSYSGYKYAYLESLLKTVNTRGCIFTLDAFKMGWDKLLGIGFSTALKIVQRSLWPTADKKHFRSLIAFVKLLSPEKA